MERQRRSCPQLLDAGASVDNYGSDTAADVTPLMESVDELEPYYDASRLVLTQLLLSAGADVARRDNTGRTGMHYASGAGRMAVEVLLAAGSDVNADGDGGATPLHEAIVPGGMSQLSKLSARAARIAALETTLAADPPTYCPTAFWSFSAVSVSGGRGGR